MTRFTQFTGGGFSTAETTSYDNTNTPQLAPADNVQDAIEILSDLSITQVDVVADIAARNALTPDVGDIAKVLDSFADTGFNEPQTYIWDGSAWVDLQETSDVISVNGQSQVVVLDTDDIAEGTTNLYYTEGRVSANLDVSANTAARHDAASIAVDGVSDDALSINASQVITANLATPTTDGVMSSADKSKLDGIAAGANNYVHPNHTGDVTSVGDGAQTIQPNVVDNTKLDDMNSQTIKGRIDPGLGNPQDLTAAQVRTIINVEDGSTADQVASEVPVTPSGNLSSTDVQAALQELQSDIDTLGTSSHVPATSGDDSLNTSGVDNQTFTVNLDGTTGGGDNKLVLTATEGLYVEPVKVGDDSLDITGQTLSVNLDGTTGGGDNVLVLTPVEGLYVPSSVGDTNLSIANQNANTLDIASDNGTDATVPAATGTLAGLLTAGDKTKLDGIETGATADQVASEVPVTPSGNLSSTNVQSALQELQGDIDTLNTDSHVPLTAGNDSITTSGVDNQTIVVNLDGVTGGGNNILSLTAGQGLYVPPDSVTSVNTQTGAVVLDTDDIAEGTTNLYYTEARVSANTDVAANTAARHDAVTLGNDGLSITGQQLSVNIDTVTGGGDNALVITPTEGLYVPPSPGNTDLAIANRTATTLDVTSSTGTDATVPFATTSLAGLLVATDKTKLDGIETGATADQNANEVPYNNTTSGLTATDVQAAIDEVEGRIDTLETIDHQPVTLNAGTVTQDSANLVGQELELVAATGTTSGVVTAAAQTFGGAKTFSGAEFPIIIDAPSATDNLEFGYFTAVTPNCYGIRQSGLSGYFCFMPNSDNPQIVLGNPANTTGSAFIDVDNNRPLNLNVLDTGAGTPAVVNIGSGGLNINTGGDLDLDGGNITLAASNTVDGVDVSSPKNSIVVDTNQYQLSGDVASPANSNYYGTNTVGTRGFHSVNNLFSGTAGLGDVLRFNGTTWESSDALNIENDGTLNVANTLNYETLIGLDDDIPNIAYLNNNFNQSAAAITDNSITRGDGGARGIQDSLWTIADDGLLTAGTSISRVGYAAEIINSLATGGGNGLLVCGGEVDGDISLAVKDQDGSLTFLEISGNLEGNVVGDTLAATLLSNGVAYGWDLQGSGDNADFNTQEGNYRKAGEIIPIQQTRFTAVDLAFPNTANWGVNGFASIAADTANSALRVRRFDDSTAEGVGFILDVPPGADNIVIRLTHRRQSGATSQAVVVDLWRRLIPNNAAIGAWTQTNLSTVTMNTNTNWQQNTFTLPISTFSLTGGNIYQFELTRNGAAVGDTLVGDWVLLYMEVDFT